MWDTYYFIPLFQVTIPFFPWSLFSLCFPCGSFPFHLSFIPISRPSPPLVQLGVWGSAVSSPSGSGQSPAAKCNLVNPGPRNERFLTCQSGKLQCSLNSVIYFYSVTVWTVLVSSQMRYSLIWVSKTPNPTWFWSFQRRFLLLKDSMVKIKKLNNTNSNILNTTKLSIHD